MIFAWGDSDPEPSSIKNQDITYHGFNNRGSSRLSLLNQIKPILDESSLDIVEFPINNVCLNFLNYRNLTKLNTFVFKLILPSDSTTYYCKLFKVPDLNEKRHIVKV